MAEKKNIEWGPIETDSTAVLLAAGPGLWALILLGLAAWQIFG